MAGYWRSATSAAKASTSGSREGWALDYRRYSPDYLQAESAAKPLRDAEIRQLADQRRAGMGVAQQPR